MTVKQAAERLEISPSLLYRLIQERRLGCVRIGRAGRKGKIIIKEEDLAAFLESCRGEPGGS